jgi:hypothetical protein
VLLEQYCIVMNCDFIKVISSSQIIHNKDTNCRCVSLSAQHVTVTVERNETCNLYVQIFGVCCAVFRKTDAVIFDFRGK